MAFSKIVGLEVIPRRPLSMRPCSSPEANIPRRRLSSQTLCPAASSCDNWLLMDTLTPYRCEFLRRHLCNIFGCKTILFCDVRRGRRRAEMIDAERETAGTNPALPAERSGGLNGHAGSHIGRQHLIAI